jgi:hypothetical protein
MKTKFTNFHAILPLTGHSSDGSQWEIQPGRGSVKA